MMQQLSLWNKICLVPIIIIVGIGWFFQWLGDKIIGQK